MGCGITSESMKHYEISWKGHCLRLGQRTQIMGVVNVTPNSFSDGGLFFQVEDAVKQGLKLVQDGADILDIGGESTRPFSQGVSAEEEIQRVIPVIRKLADRISVPISIDTTKASVVREAILAGAAMVNDVSAFGFDEEMAGVVRDCGVPVILMHMLRTPRTMQVTPEYDDVVADVKAFLKNAIKKAIESGIARSMVIIDPGIGFGKTVSHNLQLIHHLYLLHSLEVPVLIGPSRKAFIRHLLKDEAKADIRTDSPVVATGTQAAVAASVLCGAHMVRVHDVAETWATVQISDAIRNSQQAFPDSCS